MVAIGSINGWQPGRGPVTTWTASPASRDIMARAAKDPLPASFQQEDHLRTAYRAKQTGRDVPRLIMSSWDIDGWCDIAAMTEAINTHIRRHDTYHSAFDVAFDVTEDVNGITVTRRTVEDPELIEFVPTALGFMEVDEIRAVARTATPGTLEWDCFTFGVIQKDDHFTFYANIDHLHTDGMSAGLIYRDIHLTYQALTHDIPSPLPAAAVYRDFAARQNMHAASMTRYSRPVRDWAEFAREANGEWPTFPLGLGNTPANTLGGVLTVELLNAEETEAFAAACRAAGARFSGGVMACAALADNHFTGRETYRTYTPSDTRSGEAQAQSAGWYASLFPVSVPVHTDDFGRTARAAQKSFDSNKHMSSIPRSTALDLFPAEELDVTPPSGPSMMVSLMDFRGMEDADASRLGIYLDNLSHGDINTWVIRHPDHTSVTVSFPDTQEARHSVHHYIGVLRSAFTDAAELTTGWIDELDDQAFAHTA